jgi:hypothetical protein
MHSEPAAPTEVIEALREGRELPDPKLEALRHPADRAANAA